MNDVVLYDMMKMEVEEQFFFNSAKVPRRQYHCGFTIGDKLFSLGGLSMAGKLLDDFSEIDLITGKHYEALISRGKSLLQPFHSATICAVFYLSLIHI